MVGLVSFQVWVYRTVPETRYREHHKLAGNQDLIDQYEQIHAAGKYGTTAVRNLRFIRPEIELLRPQSILDYGCGQSNLMEALKLNYPVQRYRYDPAIPAISAKPGEVVDLLINIDVLEHIEEADLDEVIGDMRTSCRNAIIIIDLTPASAILPDGRNAHVTLKPAEWWKARLKKHFDYIEPIATARNSRAGFKTWPRSGVQTGQYLVKRIDETVRYYLKRINNTHLDV